MKFNTNSTIHSRQIISEISNNFFECSVHSNLYYLIITDPSFIRKSITKNIRKEQL